MKSHTMTNLLAVAAMAILTLAGCSQATSDAGKSGGTGGTGGGGVAAPKNFVFDFETAEQLFTRGQSWDTAPVLEPGNGGTVMTVTGSWGNNFVTFSPVVDLTGKTKLTLDVKGTMSGNFRISLFEGANEMQLDVLSTAYTNTSFTTVSLDFSGAVNGAFAGDLAKIDNIKIYGMGLTGTVSIDNVTCQ